MIEVTNLVKTYGSHTAVNGISFTVEPGKIYGLLGPNGAGKSTTMNIITGCLAATSGSVKINGFDIFDEPEKAKRCIGYLPEIPPLYPEMTPVEYLLFVGEAKKVKGAKLYSQVREVMEITGLTDVSSRLIKNLSKGYRQRVGIAGAMLGDPDIIILDEPTVGLDPKQIIEIRDLIRRLGETKTIILSSHILSEISAVCDRVMIISRGNLVANDTIENLEKLSRNTEKLLLCVKGKRDAIVDAILSVDGVLECEDEPLPDGTISVTVKLTSDKDIREDIFFAISKLGAAILSMQYGDISLVDIFLALTDSSVMPNEDGVLPTAEEILEAHFSKKPPETEDNENDTEAADNNEGESENNNDDDEDDYKPLFGGNN